MSPVATGHRDAFGSAKTHLADGAARRQARVKPSARKGDLFQLCARVASAVVFSLASLVAGLCALLAAIVLAPFFLLAPLAVVALLISLAAYFLSGLGLI